jgi:hypothetical protein
MGISFLFLVQWKTINNSALELLLLEKKEKEKSPNLSVMDDAHFHGGRRALR